MVKRALVFFSILFFMICVSSLHAKEKVILKVFHAGSLSVPFSKMEKEFEKKYPYIDVRREISGSVKAVRKVTELHKPCDVIAVADYTLIPKMLFPTYTGYVKLFARNELVLCYTKKSKYAKEINSSNWYKILRKRGVKWGFSNPNDDPCGYRSVISIGLASLYYKNPKLVRYLLKRYVNIRCRTKGDVIHFKVPKDLKVKGKKIFIRPKSVELLGLLESGVIDYAFEYKSVALQHGLLYAELPSEINLGSIKYANFYKRSKITLFYGKTIEGKPIVYGICVLKNAHHPKEAKLWEDFVTGKQGKEILFECKQTPIYPAKEIKAGSQCPKCKAIYFSPTRLTIATGSPGELGVLKLLAEEFTTRYPVSICWVKAGSGKALKLLKEKKVDVVMVHAPSAEKKAVKEGWATQRTLIGSNEFVIVGPKDDPADVRHATSAKDAYRRIAGKKVIFLSRGDNSGTHKKELMIWKMVGITPKGSWYVVTHNFMMATLKKANELKGYFMVDSSTWIVGKSKMHNLDLLFKGDPVLINVYHAMCQPEKCKMGSFARKFIRFLVSEKAQKIIRDYGKDKYDEPLYLDAEASKKFEH